MRNQRGFTLVEILMAMVVMLTVTGAIYKLLTTSQRLSNAQAARTDLQSNERAASLIVPSELRELNTVIGGTAIETDILTLGATNIRYRAMRGLGFVCQSAAGVISIYKDTWSGYRAPQQTRDAGYVFFQTDPSTGSDGTWQTALITAVGTGTACPGGAASYTLTMPGLAAPDLGAPVRLFEVMEMGLYPSGGKWWLGVQSVSAGELTKQPLLGPLKEATGLTLKYYDQTGATETTDPNNVRSILVTIKGITNGAVSTGGGSSNVAVVEDSVVSRVTLRNALR
ncbi:MAG TPA: prepilin-type N-terminal cleavage/methylation domain-containing protein [Gemmatimonadales bacterium]|nr:prepilin-type N-terminal cleavage/methylation domain-containing protein [Gemmatimonadales bacterium]